mmetsp:Transcript_29624/g.36064  ORF Transcript_29624/g.36064 Transcript_29624/m.36064 type:complete len:196 (-) Transcript_29624:30-617(-)
MSHSSFHSQTDHFPFSDTEKYERNHACQPDLSLETPRTNENLNDEVITSTKGCSYSNGEILERDDVTSFCVIIQKTWIRYRKQKHIDERGRAIDKMQCFGRQIIAKNHVRRLIKGKQQLDQEVETMYNELNVFIYVTRMQSCWRSKWSRLQRRIQMKQLCYLKRMCAVKIQSWVRCWMIRQWYCAYRENFLYYSY